MKPENRVSELISSRRIETKRLEVELDNRLSQYVEELARMRSAGAGHRMSPGDVVRELIEEAHQSFLLQEMIRKVRP